MPNLGKKETRDAFVARYMGDEEAKKKFPDEKQRLAVAFSEWKASKKKMAANEAAQIFVQNHPGHADQKVHGHKGGGKIKGAKNPGLDALDVVGKSPTSQRRLASGGTEMEWSLGKEGASAADIRAGFEKRGYKLSSNGVNTSPGYPKKTSFMMSSGKKHVAITHEDAVRQVRDPSDGSTSVMGSRLLRIVW